MFWPFSRHKAQQEELVPVYSSDLSPIPINNTNYEDSIVSFLEQAGEVAKTRQPGETFDLTFPEGDRRQFNNPYELIAPVMVRCDAYGAQFMSCFDWTFTFEVIDRA